MQGPDLSGYIRTCVPCSRTTSNPHHTNSQRPVPALSPRQFATPSTCLVTAATSRLRRLPFWHYVIHSTMTGSVPLSNSRGTRRQHMLKSNAQAAARAEHPANPLNPSRVRANSDSSHPGQSSELGPLVRIASPDPNHFDALHRQSSDGRLRSLRLHSRAATAHLCMLGSTRQ